MKAAAFWIALFPTLLIFSFGGLNRAYGAGTVSGVVQVKKAKIKTAGAKHTRDVVVYLEPVKPAAYPPPVDHAIMDQRGLVFIPHVMAVQKGTTIDFLNSDNDRHNVYFLDDKRGDTLDIGTWGPGESVSHTFVKDGLFITLCQLHLEMAAYILVLEYPFYEVVQIDDKTSTARFEIRGVPPGEYWLNAWHKKLKIKGGRTAVVVGEGETVVMHIEITRSKYAN